MELCSFSWNLIILLTYSLIKIHRDIVVSESMFMSHQCSFPTQINAGTGDGVMEGDVNLGAII